MISRFWLRAEEYRGEDGRRAEDAGGVLVRWPWQRAQASRAQAGEHQKQRKGHEAAGGQGDSGGGIRCPSGRGGRDDPEADEGEEQDRRRLEMAGDIRPGRS